MSSIEQRIYDGDRARDILENPVYHWVFEEIEKELTESWKSSPARAEADREKIYLALQMLTKIKSAIQGALETGQLARMELDHKESQRNLVTRIKEAWQ